MYLGSLGMEIQDFNALSSEKIHGFHGFGVKGGLAVNSDRTDQERKRAHNKTTSAN